MVITVYIGRRRVTINDVDYFISDDEGHIIVYLSNGSMTKITKPYKLEVSAA